MSVVLTVVRIGYVGAGWDAVAASAFLRLPKVGNSSPRAAAEPMQYFKKSLLKSFTETPFS
jgi:hypothetical protein